MNKIYKKIVAVVAGIFMVGSLSAQVELVTDGSFEAGIGSGAWTESSTTFGTPLCDLAGCGTGTGTGPRTGNIWAWFGGLGGGVETASIEQSFVIPVGGTVTLSFYLEQIICDDPADFMDVLVDGNIVFSTDGSSTLCGVLGYSQQVIDISAYADGNSHTLTFNSSTFSLNGGVTNFFVDDISVISSTGGGGTCPDIIVDGNFELGPGSGSWTEASTNFGTPLCDLAGCGAGGGTGPNGGTYWSWFGGFGGGTEISSLTQTVTFPAGDSITLEFALEQAVCDGPTDFLEITVDGIQVFLTDGASPLCGVIGYSSQVIDLSLFADGNPHVIAFNSTTFSANGGVTNFFVDDVVLSSCPTGAGGNTCTDTIPFTALNIAIPDNDPVGLTNSQTVSSAPGTTLGGDVELAAVCFKIDHTWVGDLIVTLTAPNGESVILTDRPGIPASLAGCDGDNLDVCVTTGTGNEMENECNNLPAISGSWTAANGADLELINNTGGSPNGSWSINISDNAGLDTGSLIEWSLVFDNGPVANWVSPGTVCGSAAPINLDPTVVGLLGGTWSGSGVTGNTFDPAGLSGPIAVTYTVSDVSTGCSDSETNEIIVDGATPVAAFTYIATSLSVGFTNTTATTGTYLWDFGDGNTSTLENPTNLYSAAGTYTVSLTVTNACGTNTVTQSITIQGCPDIVVDGSFEAGIGSGSWTEFSATFGTPLCDLAGCGNGTGTGPNTGNIWAWFGGVAAFEEGSLSQTFTIPTNNTANLSFFLEQIICDSPDDFLKVAIDADTVYTTDGASPLCGVLGYSQQVVNLDAYADGLPHTLTFFSRIYGNNGAGTNFFVDDIAINVCAINAIVETNLNLGVDVMPVPANDYVDVKFTDVTASDVVIEVSDMIGRNVFTKNIATVNGNQSSRIDVSNWSKGVYMLKVSADGSSTIRKIVVE
jgi:PKD repeat protein